MLRDIEVHYVWKLRVGYCMKYWILEWFNRVHFQHWFLLSVIIIVLDWEVCFWLTKFHGSGILASDGWSLWTQSSLKTSCWVGENIFLLADICRLSSAMSMTKFDPDSHSKYLLALHAHILTLLWLEVIPDE